MSDHNDEDGIEDDDADFDFDLNLDAELGVAEAEAVSEIIEADEAEMDAALVLEEEEEEELIISLEKEVEMTAATDLFDEIGEIDDIEEIEEIEIVLPEPVSVAAPVFVEEEVDLEDTLFAEALEPVAEVEDAIEEVKAEKPEAELIMAAASLKKKATKKERLKRPMELALPDVSSEETEEIAEKSPFDEPPLDEPNWDDDWGSKKNRSVLPEERGGPPNRNRPRSRSTKSSKSGAFGGWDIKGLRQNKMAYVALGITGVVIVALLFIFNKGDDEKGGEKGVSEGGAAESAMVVPIDQTEAMNAVPVDVTQDEMLEYLNKYATETAKAFFAAESVEGILATSREPDKIRSKVTEYYRRKPFRPMAIEKVVLDEITMIDDHTLLVGKAVKTDGRAVLVVMEKTAKGLLMEWEYQVAYDPMAWDAFVADRPEGAMDFRVMCTAATDYVAPFTKKEGDYFAMEITSKSGDSKVLGYISRASEKGRELSRIVQNEFEVPVILTLRFPTKQETSAHNAVYIEDLVADGWIIAY